MQIVCIYCKVKATHKNEVNLAATEERQPESDFKVVNNKNSHARKYYYKPAQTCRFAYF